MTERQFGTDRQLRDDVIAELDWEPGIESAEIGVAVEAGVVTLTGHVPTYAQKMKAEQAAQRVRGVRAIAQEIEVRPPQASTRADDEIAKRAVRMLAWDVTVPTDAVQIKVQEGWVTLHGEVDWEFQRRAAEDDVRKLGGVIGVSNLVTLRQRVLATDIEKRIRAALQRSARVEADAIKVSVAGGKVTLQGKVDSWHDREVLESAVWAAPGVHSIEDQVTIG